jgi:pimeloyl-ACP methyl ester carboxylesterase
MNDRHQEIRPVHSRARKKRRLDHVISRDGTRIAYERSGTGPPLVLVHGTAIDHRQWTDLTPRLGAFFTVYSVDRRGRGDSGDAPHYALDREFEDVAEMIDSIPGEVNLLGHSYGAICALEATLLATNVRRLALYEPPIRANVEVSYPADTVERFTEHLRAGEAESALLVAYEAAQTPQETLDLLRSLPSWRARVSAAHTVLREFMSAGAYAFDPKRFGNLEIPTLLLVGGDSPPHYRAPIDALHQSLPHSRISVLHGQQHEAMETAPELFLREVLGFFLHDKHPDARDG